MNNSNRIAARFNRPVDINAPRITEQFASDLMADISALVAEDFIAIRAILRSFDDEEIQEFKESLNFFKHQIGTVKSARQKRVVKENEIALSLNLCDGA